MKRLALGFALALMCACGGDDGGGGSPDAATSGPDAAPLEVASVDCGSVTPDQTITTSGFMYSPMSVTITTGQVVMFTPASAHDVASDDGKFSVPLGGTGCFRFNQAGTYGFHCTPHGFTGSVVVQ